jgi:hypothetical protein
MSLTGRSVPSTERNTLNVPRTPAAAHGARRGTSRTLAKATALPPPKPLPPRSPACVPRPAAPSQQSRPAGSERALCPHGTFLLWGGALQSRSPCTAPATMGFIIRLMEGRNSTLKRMRSVLLPADSERIWKQGGRRHSGQRPPRERNKRRYEGAGGSMAGCPRRLRSPGIASREAVTQCIESRRRSWCRRAPRCWRWPQPRTAAWAAAP